MLKPSTEQVHLSQTTLQILSQFAKCTYEVFPYSATIIYLQEFDAPVNLFPIIFLIISILAFFPLWNSNPIGWQRTNQKMLDISLGNEHNVLFLILFCLIFGTLFQMKG